MDLNRFIECEMVAALGCTEPSSIACAGLTAAHQLGETVEKIELTVDPRIYKNCYAVGIPHSGHKTGIKWAAAIGANLEVNAKKLECFKSINDKALKNAQHLVENDKVFVKIDKKRDGLFIDFRVFGKNSSASCLIEGTHTNIIEIRKNSKIIFKQKKGSSSSQNEARVWAHHLSIEKMISLIKGMDKTLRKKIREGASLNLEIARHGETLFPKSFIKMISADAMAHSSGLVCCGVYARMNGEDFPVMSIAGSGNKGITCSIPILELERTKKLDPKIVEEALALAVLVSSKTTEELGTLSAVCGCSNAAGIGLACALVYLMGGDAKQISYAINNMVGNVTGMICDGAKIGCALKTMTSVDAAFRSATLALNNLGIPPADGIVGKSGEASLKNLGTIAKKGMMATDLEILKIMEEKLRC